jgi:uncharacterized protein (TIGR03067 family)
MSRRLCTFLVLGFLIGAADAQKPDETNKDRAQAKKADQSKKDLDDMQGNWHAVALEVKGTPSGEDAIKKIKFILKKDDYSVKVDGKDHVSAKLVLRAEKKPKELDLVQETGPVYKGIYEMDGDTLKICLCLSSDADSERPKEFKSAEDSNTALFSWHRDR